jgi:N-acetylmuramoyl-L-alanine amidase
MTRPTLLPFFRAGDRRGRGLLGSRAFRLALPAAALPVAAPLAFPPAALAGLSTATATYVVQPGDTLSGVALRLGTDVTTLVRLNRLGDPDLLLAGTTLVVPGRPTPTPALPRPTVVSYAVRPGDTVWDIANRTGTTVTAVLDANHLPQDARIRPGQVLRLPGARLPAVPARPRPKPAAPVAVHVVRLGETLSGIALRYDVHVETLLRANRLAADAVIRPGQKLVLPGVPVRATPRGPVPPTHAYVVRRGDTLSAIALVAHVPLTTVMALNHLKAADVILPGQRLLLPGATPTSSREPGRARAAAGSPSATAEVRAAAAAHRAALAGRTFPNRHQVRALITTTARRYGVDPSLALGIAAEESGFDQRRVSSANAIGVMQVIPSSGRWAAALVGRPLDLLDTADNVVAGVAILAALRSAAREHVAVAAYYQGLGSVRGRGMYADTRRYVANVLTLRERYR